MQEVITQGYTAYGNIEENGNRGILVYVSNRLISTEVTLDPPPAFTEAVIMDIKLRSRDILRICTIYRSPNSSNENSDNLNQLLRLLYLEEKTHMLIIGDFNYPEIDWSNNICNGSSESNASKFLSTINHCFWKQHVDQPTRARAGNNPNTLDLVITNEEGMVETITYESPLGKSDHSLLNFDFNCYALEAPSVPSRFNFAKANIEQIRKDLDIKWDEEMKDMTPEEQWNFLALKLSQAQEENIPKNISENGKHRLMRIP